MRHKFILQSMAMLIVLFSIFFTNVRLLCADSTPYTLVDSLEQYETDLHKIYGVMENDAVLIGIQPEGEDNYDSRIYDPDMVFIDSDYGSGGHDHQLIAEKAGDYFLKLYTDYPDVGNYTVKSSHRLTPDDGTPDFRVESLPSTLKVEKGSSADAIITVHSENGFNSPVSLSVISTPPNVNVLFSSTTVTPPPNGQVNSTLTVQVDSSATEGTYILNVTGESDNLFHRCEINLIVKKTGAYLEINLSRSIMTYKSAVNVSGSISPPIADIEIQLEYRLDGSQWDVLKNVKTNSYGKISYLNWKPTTTGYYELRAYWSGNEEFDEVRSQIKNLRVDKAFSSIHCSLDSSQITYGENVTISANLDVPLSTGMVILQWTSNNISWNDIVLHAPSEGTYTHFWAPDAGLYFIQAKWTGDNNYLPSISSSRKLTVEKRLTELTTELSANIVNSGEYVTITVSTSPVLTGENITIQVAKNSDDWQNLVSNVTNSLGMLTYMWLPENYRQFWIRSSWVGTKNYEGNVSKPALLIVEKGFPTIPTQITDISVPPNIELRENTYVSYNVIIVGAQNVIHSGNESIDTSHLGTFDFHIIYIGNETYKSTLYKGEYTVNKIETQIVINYAPKHIEVGHSAYVNYSVCEKKSGKIIYTDSLKLDTSSIGFAYVIISYVGNETHNPQSYRHNYEIQEEQKEVIRMWITIISLIFTGITIPLIGIYLNHIRKRKK